MCEPVLDISARRAETDPTRFAHGEACQVLFVLIPSCWLVLVTLVAAVCGAAASGDGAFGEARTPG